MRVEALTKGLLDEMGHAYGEGINTAIYENYQAKQEILKFMAQFPTYEPDKMRVRFDLEITIPLDMRSIKYSISRLPIDHDELLTILRYTMTDDLLIDDFHKLLFKRYGINVGVGSKMSKAIRKVVEKYYTEKCTHYGVDIERFKTTDWYKDSERRFAELSDMMNRKPEQLTFYIGCSIYDFLRMSNGNSWGSCHSIDFEYGDGELGCHTSGTISYALDTCSLLLYQEAKEGRLITRQHGLIDEMSIGFGRVYGNDRLNTRVVEMIADKIAEVYNTTISSTYNRTVSSNRTTKYSTHYADYTSWDLTFNSFDMPISNIEENAPIGNRPICIECGTSHSESGVLSCCKSEKFRCYHCGDTFSEDEIFFLSDFDRYVCDECYPTNYVNCRHCNEVELIDDMNDYRGEHVCNSCIDYRDYTRCEDCGSLVRGCDITSIIDDETGYTTYLCDDCI